MKQHVNIDPGVHSSLNLDQLAPGTPITPIPTVPTLPTITEGKIPDQSSSGDSSGGSVSDLKNNLIKNPRLDEIRQQDGGRVRRESTPVEPDFNNAASKYHMLIFSNRLLYSFGLT